MIVLVGFQEVFVTVKAERPAVKDYPLYPIMEWGSFALVPEMLLN
jgi:hypothetical protein